ncbi:LysR family transcriptional regulator [Alteromonas lipolytica]|uniref:HTH lysR-type domain-containing protein n=1 Tax=Alteromonas lipolytica TaxID=1856405 RepID=A0A1E8FI85_9ALTE|nr:LysR family transcriptional regulator [Alteromonas lipolytica]OFI35619.1 hypothetical protein BFC17_12760 [Alteromonas lipolytica]GGF77653.1 transcriptional regulator [Alteromonas lipolytica]
MRLDKLDLNLFVVFDMIYREASVSKAAERLNMTQPAISNALARLRDSLGDPLFVRTSEGMQPTPVSDSIIGDVRQGLDLLGRCKAEFAQFDPRTATKTFRLAMNDLAEALLLPPLIQRLSEEAPGVRITCYYHDRDTAVDELKSDKYDLLIDTPTFNPKELGSEHLMTLDYLVMLNQEHPLVSGMLTLKDYRRAEHVHVSSRRRGRGHVDIALHKLGESRTIKTRIQNYQVAARITQNTDLLWTAPAPVARLANLATQSPPFDIDPLIWNVFWQERNEDDPATLWLRDMVKKAAFDCHAG